LNKMRRKKRDSHSLVYMSERSARSSFLSALFLLKKKRGGVALEKKRGGKVKKRTGRGTAARGLAESHRHSVTSCRRKPKEARRHRKEKGGKLIPKRPIIEEQTR